MTTRKDFSFVSEGSINEGSGKTVRIFDLAW